MSLKDDIIKQIKKPDPKPFLFLPGQMGRVHAKVSHDGQTPGYWDGAKVQILSRHRTTILKNHIYKVRHLSNNKICTFSEDELDRRFIKKEL